MKKTALAVIVAGFALLAFAVYSGKAVGYSVWNGHGGILRLVIALGAPVDREYISAYTPLGIATEFGDTDSMRILIAAGASPNNSEFGPSPMGQAVHMRKLDVLQVLLEGGGDANATTPPIARSLLIIAAVGGDAAKVRLLLKHGADLFYRDTEGHDAYTLVTKTPDELPSDGWTVRPDFRNQEIADILQAEIEKRK